jgi:hypothetical protein
VAPEARKLAGPERKSGTQFKAPFDLRALVQQDKAKRRREIRVHAMFVPSRRKVQ